MNDREYAAYAKREVEKNHDRNVRELNRLEDSDEAITRAVKWFDGWTYKDGVATVSQEEMKLQVEELRAVLRPRKAAGTPQPQPKVD